MGLELDAKNRSGLAGLWGYVTYSNNLVNNFYLLIKHSLTYGTLKYQILIEYNVFLLQNMYAQLLPLALPTPPMGGLGMPLMPPFWYATHG